MSVCVCACTSAGLRPSLFPKEVSLDNKHSHSSSPADLINKTSSSEYTLSLSPSLTHTDHLFHTLQVNTNSFQHMRWHAFMFAGERREEESWAYLLPVIAPSYDPPPPQNSPQLSLISSHSLRHSHASKKNQKNQQKKNPHTAITRMHTIKHHSADASAIHLALYFSAVAFFHWHFCFWRRVGTLWSQKSFILQK